MLVKVVLGLLLFASLSEASAYPRIGQGFRGQRPPTFDAWHPAVRTLDSYIAYNRALVERLSEANSTMDTINIMRHEKEVLRSAHLAHFGPARRFDGSGFLSGLVASLEQNAESSLLNSLTGGLYGCAKDLVDDLISVYNYFEYGYSLSVWDTVSKIAGTVSDCLSGLASSVPIIGALVAMAKAIANADTIYNDCSAFIGDIQGSSFDEHQFGFDLGSCVIAVANAARRRMVASTPPATWLCAPSYYNSSDGCDIGCGAFDPDCYSGSQLTFYPRGRLTAPSGWICPVAYYGANDGCDMGCGAADPDCEMNSPTTAATVYPWNASQDFSIEAYNQLATTLQATGTPVQAGAAGSSSSASTVGVAVGSVLGAALIVLAALVIAFRRKKHLVHAQAAQLAALLPQDQHGEPALVDGATAHA